MIFVLICEPVNDWHELFGPFATEAEAKAFADAENAATPSDANYSFEVIASKPIAVFTRPKES